MLVVLGSGSPRRKALMSLLPVDVTVQVPGVDESAIEGNDPVEVAVRRARAKFDAICAERRSELIVAADTVVVVDGERLGKPVNEAHARRMLERLSGQTIDIVTALVVGTSERPRPGRVVTSVRLHDLSDADVADYLASNDVLDKAGALALQDGAAGFIDQLDGCWSNVVGLPVCAVAERLDLAAHSICGEQDCGVFS